MSSNNKNRNQHVPPAFAQHDLPSWLSEDYFKAQKQAELWQKQQADSLSVLSKLLDVAQSTKPIELNQPAVTLGSLLNPGVFDSLNQLAAYTSAKYDPPRWDAEWLKVPRNAYESFKLPDYFPPKLEPPQGYGDWFEAKAENDSFGSLHNSAEAAKSAISWTSQLPAIPWEGKNLSAMDAAMSKAAQSASILEKAQKLSNVAPKMPYMTAAAAPQIEQIAKAVETQPAQTKPKVVPVNPAVETNKLLRELIQANQDAREEVVQERAENRKLNRDYAELKEKYADLKEDFISLQARVQSSEARQESLETKMDKGLAMIEAMHYNLDTVASFVRDTRESLGGPPKNMPESDLPDDDDD
jgi:hypothetical protein